VAKSLPEETIQAWARLARAQAAVLQRTEADLAAADLPSLEWYDVLLELDRAEDGRLRHRELHPKLLIAKYNLSRLIDRLEREGLVERKRSPGDGRGADIAITEKGRALRRRMWPVYQSAIAKHFASRLTSADIKALNEALPKLR